MTELSLTQFLTTKIPVTKALGFEILNATVSEVRIRAPLKLNSNHMDTAFGGSLSTLMILACYSWLFTLLDQNDVIFHIVIKEATTKYLAPVTEDIIAICQRPDDQEINQFLKIYQKKRVARLKLSAFVEIAGGQKACTLDGIFVARPES